MSDLPRTRGDVVQRLASIGLIAGGVVTGAANLLHPRFPGRTLDDVRPLLEVVNRVGIGYWKIDHFFLCVGIWLLGIGWFGMRRAIANTPGEPFATIGFYAVVVATALWTAVFVMDMNVGLVATRWHAASAEPTKPMWIAAANAVSSLSFELDAMAQVVQWACFGLFGVAIVRSRIMPRAMGWAGIVISLVFLPLVALPQFFAGPSDLVTNMLFPAMASVSIGWLILFGVWLARRVW